MKTKSKDAKRLERERNIITLAKNVMGWAVHGRAYPGPGFWIYLNPPELNSALYLGDSGIPSWNPYESIADAWMLVEKLREQNYGIFIDTCDHSPTGAWAFEASHTTLQYVRMEGQTICEAICRAALATAQEGK